MNTPILFTLGTPGGCWPAWARSLLQTAPAGSRLLLPAFSAWHDALDLPKQGPAPSVSDACRAKLDSLIPADADAAPWGGLDSRACWSLDALAQRFPSASFLVFVERPAIGLARALAEHTDLDPNLWLASWREGARRILRHHQRQPRRSILVDTQEAHDAPASLLAVLRTQLGAAAAPAGPCEPPTDGDVLALALSEALTLGDADAQTILEELVTACQPLSELDPVRYGKDAPRIAAERALHRFHELLQAASSAQEELESLHLKFRATEELAAEQSARVKALSASLEDAKSHLGPRQSELDAARSQAEAASQESELLLLQLHQVQEELEHYYLECRKIQGAAKGAGADTGRWSALGFKGSISEARPTLERDTPPHREVTFEVTGVKTGTRELAECTVRLVEHHGHPGLVLFANPEGPQLLERWTESGREGDRPYLLLVPSDLQSRTVLESLSTDDWLILQALALKMEGSLEEAGSQLATRWRAVARRLREQLLELPRRFRFQAVVAEFDETQGRVVLEFRGVHCGVRQVERLTLHWCLHGPQAGFSLLRDPDGGVPLTSWPCGDDGSTPERLTFLLGPRTDEQSRRQQWLSLGLPDRDFLLAML